MVVVGLILSLTGCMPPGPRALLDGERLIREGRAEDAIRRLRTAVEFLPSNPQAWNHLGLAYHAAKKPSEAVEAYQQALRLDRNLAVAYFNSGCLYLEHGEPTLATDALWAFVGLQPRAVEGWVRLGQAQLRTRKWDQAERSFSEALRLAPGRVDALNGLGIALHQRRKVQEAWESFTNAVIRDPGFAPAWMNLGVVAHQSGAPGKAVQAYKQYVSLRPAIAQQLQLEAVIRRLEAPPPRPVIQLPPAAEPPAQGASGGVTNASAVGAAVGQPGAPMNPGESAVVEPPGAKETVAAAPASDTNTIQTVAGTGAIAVPADSAIAGAPALGQPRPPPGTATAGVTSPDTAPASEPAPASAAAAAVEVAGSGTNALPADGVKAASEVGVREGEGAGVAVAAVPVADPSVSPPVEVVPAEVISGPDPQPGLVLPTPAPVAPGVGTVASAPDPALVVPVDWVKLEPLETLVTGVRDEAVSGASGGSAGGTAVAAAGEGAGGMGEGLPPLVRPVTRQRSTVGSDRSDRRGFWSRANPAGWFDGEGGKAAEGREGEAVEGSEAGSEPAATVAASSAEDGGWRWVNPLNWFRGSGEAGGGDTAPGWKPESVEEPLAAAEIEASRRASASAVATAAASAPGVGGANTSGVSAVVGPRRLRETGWTARPAGGVSVPGVDGGTEVRRYAYLKPEKPSAGNRGAARGVLARAMEEHRRGRPEAAVRLYEEALRLDPALPEARQNLAVAALQVGDVPKALVEGEKALVLQPETPLARLNFALALDRAGFAADAAAEAERVVAVSPNDVSAHLLLGNLYAQKLGRPDRARVHYRRVIDLDPGHPQGFAIRQWLADAP